jgi:hypothetical protein
VLKMKKLLVLVLIVFMIGVMYSEVEAASSENQRPPAPTEGTPVQIPDNTNASTSSELETQSTTYLKTWSVWIKNPSGNTVDVSGDTESYSAVDTIAVKLYLQYWDGEKWVDIAYVGEFKDSNTSYVWGSGSLDVSSGYYYRTRGVHYVIEDGLSEKVNSASSHIYID